MRPDDHLVALRTLAERRDELGAARTATVSRPHRLLLELIPGGAKQFLSVTQARKLLATVRPRDLVGKIRHQLTAELTNELATLDKKTKAADKQLTDLLTETHPLDIEGSHERTLCLAGWWSGFRRWRNVRSPTGVMTCPPVRAGASAGRSAVSSGTACERYITCLNEPQPRPSCRAVEDDSVRLLFG
jgi:hypothetical protein